MNYELAVMALDGLSRAPIRVEICEGGVEIEGEPAAFREFARLLLLLSGDDADAEEQIVLAAGIHVERDSPRVIVKLRPGSAGSR